MKKILALIMIVLTLMLSGCGDGHKETFIVQSVVDEVYSDVTDEYILITYDGMKYDYFFNKTSVDYLFVDEHICTDYRSVGFTKLVPYSDCVGE